jgi:hypothetical protein
MKRGPKIDPGGDDHQCVAISPEFAADVVKRAA